MNESPASLRLQIAELCDPRPGTLWHLFANHYRRRNRSAGTTARQYRVQLTHLRRHLGREPLIDDLTDDMLSDFLNHRAESVAIPTANKAYWCVVALWRTAADLGLIATRPTVQALPEPETIPFAWLIEEVQAILRTCSLVPGDVGGVPASLWWLGLHWFIWSTGERIGAALAIKRSDVNLARGEVLVPAAARKGRRKPRLYKLLPQAVQVLEAMHDIERELLFPFPFDNVTLYNRYKKILKAAGLPTDRKCKFHKMRRSFASYVEAAGGNSTDALDHSSRSVTRRSYLDPRICGGRNPAELLPALNDTGKAAIQGQEQGQRQA